MLRDGSPVLIRQVRATDAPLLADGFARLSARSRQMRFLGPKKTLSAAELRYFTEVDHHDHEAIGALSPADGRGVGIARYIRDPDDPEAAEIAVTIADDWQGRGLGTELLARLSDRARQAGICRFTATVAADNAAMTRLLWKMGAELTGRGRGTVDYEVALKPVDDYSLDWWFRCVDDGACWPGPDAHRRYRGAAAAGRRGDRSSGRTARARARRARRPQAGRTGPGPAPSSPAAACRW